MHFIFLSFIRWIAIYPVDSLIHSLNNRAQDYTHPDDHNLPTNDMAPGFKPFTVSRLHFHLKEVPFLFDN